jgi:hypothetical protein
VVPEVNGPLNERIARFDSPFRRLDALLAGVVPNPNLPPIVMSVGEPQDPPPSLLADAIAAHAHLWNRYPPAVGTPEFRGAALGYVGRRYPSARGRIDPDVEVSPVTSSREGLYLAAQIATSPSRACPGGDAESVYQTHRAAVIMAGAEPAALAHSGFRIAPDLLRSMTPRGPIETFLVLAVNPDGPSSHDTLVTGDRGGPGATPPGWLTNAAEPAETPRRALDMLAALDASPRWLDNVLAALAVEAFQCGFVLGPRDRQPTSWLPSTALNGTACTPLCVARRGDSALVGRLARRGDARPLASAQDTADRLLGSCRLLLAAVRLLPLAPRR